MGKYDDSTFMLPRNGRECICGSDTFTEVKEEVTSA